MKNPTDTLADPTPSADSRAQAGTLWLDLIEHLACGIALYDAQDRLRVCNADFRRLYAPMADALVAGRTFEDMLRAAVGRGLIPEAAGNEEAWVRQRLQQHREPGAPQLRRLPDGRWRRIIETRLADGSLLAFSVDVTEVVETADRLDVALRDARLAGERLQDAVEAIPAGFELWDVDERLLTCNSQLRLMYPMIAHLLVPGARWEDLVRHNHATGALDVRGEPIDAYVARRRVARRAGPATAEHATGDGRRYRTIEQPTRDGGLVGIRVEVTELHTQGAAAEQARRDADATRQRLEDAIEALPDGFALYDADDRLVACNTKYRELYRESAPAITEGTRFEDVLRYGLAHRQYPAAAADPEGWLAARMERHRHPGGPQIQELPGNRWLRIDERKTRDGGIAGVRTDVTELVRREQRLQELNAELDKARAQLEQLSETDGLTAIANRRQFDRRLAEEWSRIARHGSPLALLMIDVDHFKRFNDAHGHPAGDECLRRVADVLARCVGRTTDLVARYGGEEFAVLLPYTAADAAVMMARRCIAALDAERIAHGHSPVADHVTVSIGGAAAAYRPDTEAESLLQAADRALYRAKAAGRHRAEFEPLP